MKLQYLGTAAAEGIPGIFCGCPVCQEARAKKGRHFRTRSQAIIDDTLLVDFNADTYAHSLQHGIDLSKLEHVIITHVHEDHYYPYDFLRRQEGFANSMQHETLVVHGSEDVEAFARKEWEALSVKPEHVLGQNRIAFDALKPYETKEIAGFEVTPLPATHFTPHPYVYVIAKAGKTMFYYNDSGYLTEEAMTFLREKKIQFDLVSYDCTWGKDDAGPSANASHLGLPNIVEMRERFIKNGNYKENTISIITHFSHKIQGVGYEDMLPIAKENGFLLSYDGMVVEF